MNNEVVLAVLQTKPCALYPGEGPVVQSPRARIVVTANREQTDGRFNLFEVICRPGYATSLHIHYAEDIAVYVLDGSLTLFWGNETKEGRVGALFFQPRGTPHGFRVDGPTPARILYLAFPAGLDQFVLDHGQIAPDVESVTAAARYQIEVLGPLPE